MNSLVSTGLKSTTVFRYNLFEKHEADSPSGLLSQNSWIYGKIFKTKSWNLTGIEETGVTTPRKTVSAWSSYFYLSLMYPD